MRLAVFALLLLAAADSFPVSPGSHSRALCARSRAAVFARANTQARRSASTRAKVANCRRKTNKVNEFGLKYKTRFKTQTTKVDVLLLEPVSGLGAAGERVSVAVPQWENSLRPKRRARLLRPDELDPSETDDESGYPLGHWPRTPVSRRPTLAVHDGVFSAASEAVLASAAECAGVYRRADGASTAAEHAIESLLRGMGDDESSEVEYWMKESWVEMEAHRDADEEAASVEGVLRLPSRVLLVYGEVADGLAAPTVLWCGPQSKRVLAHDGRGAEGTEGGGDGGRLVLVPAVAGRVLEFEGGLMHAVPWCVGAEDAEASQTRRVLVINCWSDHAPSEEDEEEEEAVEAEAEGALIGEEETADAMADAVAACCEPRKAWKRASVVPGVLAAEFADEGATEGVATDEWTFALSTFGSDAPLVTVVRASEDNVASIISERSQPQWLRTVTPTPPPHSGIPSMDGAREER
jgi:hypothetical protein